MFKKSNKKRVLAFILSFVMLMVGMPEIAQAKTISSDWSQFANKENNEKWINSVVHEPNSVYVEGMSVPQRFILNNVTSSSAIKYVSFEYQFISNNNDVKAFDFITSWGQAKEAAKKYTGQEWDDDWIWKLSPGLKVEDFNEDLFKNYLDISIPLSIDNAKNKEKEYEKYYGDRTLRIYSSEELDNAYITLEPYTEGSDEKRFTVSWEGNAEHIMILYASHISIGDDTNMGWGVGKGAGSISGASYHNYVVDSNITNFGNMDQQVKVNKNFAGIKSIDITKSADKSKYEKVDDVINYTIKIENTGGVPLTGVNVQDELLKNETYVSGDVNNNNKLDIHEIWIYEGSYSVKQGDLDNGSITNEATVYTNETEPKSDSVTVTAKKNPSMSINKSANRSTYSSVGDVINYTIRVKNEGNIALTEITVVDPLIKILTGPRGDINANNKLDVGETWTYTGSYFITQDDIDEKIVDNTATADSKETAPLSASVQATVLESESDTPSMSIKKEAIDTSFSKIGDVIRYEITVDNTGNVSLTNVTVIDALLEDLVFKSGDTNNDGILDEAETWKYEGSYTITQNDLDSGSVTNVATADSNETSPIEDSVIVTGVQSPSMTIEKTADKSTYSNVGDEINYTIKIENKGNITLTNVTIDDPLINKLTGPIGDNGDKRLDVDETWTYTGRYEIVQGDIDEGKVINKVTADSNETDPIDDSVTVNYVEEEEEEDPPIITNRYKVSIEKKADINKYSNVGDVINYTVTLKNNGNRVLTNIKVIDPLLETLIGPEGDTDQDKKLDLNETWVYSGSYTVTEADLEKGSILNTVTVESKEAPTDEDSVTVKRKVEDEESIEIIDDDVPLGDISIPEEITDETVPQEILDVQAEEEQSDEIIEEDPVPKGTIPYTGGFLNNKILLAIGSTLVLAGFVLKRKKIIKG